MRWSCGVLVLAASGCGATARPPRPGARAAPPPVQVPAQASGAVTAIASCEPGEIERVTTEIARALGRTESEAATATVRALAAACGPQLDREDPIALAREGDTLEHAGKIAAADSAYARAFAIALARAPGSTIDYEVAGDSGYHHVVAWWSPDATALVQDGTNQFFVWSALGDPRILPGDPVRWVSPTTMLVRRTEIANPGLDLWDVFRSAPVHEYTAADRAAEPYYFDDDHRTLHVGKLTFETRDLTDIEVTTDRAFIALSDTNGTRVISGTTGETLRPIEGGMHWDLSFVGDTHDLLYMNVGVLKRLNLDTGTDTEVKLEVADLAVAGDTVLVTAYERIIIADLKTMKRVDQFATTGRLTKPSIGKRYIAATKNDLTVELWDRAAPHAHVASLRLIEPTERGRDVDWIARLEDGRFDASPTLRDRLVWKIGATSLPGAVVWKFLRTPGVALPLFAP